MITRTKLPQPLLTMSIFACLTWSMLFAAEPPAQFPTVVGVQVPVYPKILRAAHYDGVVRLRVSTDGRRAVTIDQISGQAMLVKAAAENVKTWEFEQHKPTSFEVLFRFRLLPSTCDSECNCSTVEPPSVVLRLPTEVEITAPTLMTCDPFTARPK